MKKNQIIAQNCDGYDQVEIYQNANKIQSNKETLQYLDNNIPFVNFIYGNGL